MACKLARNYSKFEWRASTILYASLCVYTSVRRTSGIQRSAVTARSTKNRRANNKPLIRPPEKNNGRVYIPIRIREEKKIKAKLDSERRKAETEGRREREDNKERKVPLPAWFDSRFFSLTLCLSLSRQKARTRLE